MRVYVFGIISLTPSRKHKSFGHIHQMSEDASLRPPAHRNGRTNNREKFKRLFEKCQNESQKKLGKIGLQYILSLLCFNFIFLVNKAPARTESVSQNDLAMSFKRTHFPPYKRVTSGGILIGKISEPHYEPILDGGVAIVMSTNLFFAFNV
jgi:hypothetical protein